MTIDQKYCGVRRDYNEYDPPDWKATEWYKKAVQAVYEFVRERGRVTYGTIGAQVVRENLDSILKDLADARQITWSDSVYPNWVTIGNTAERGTINKNMEWNGRRKSMI